MEFLDNNKFLHFVDMYEWKKYVKSFTCWNKLMALKFGHPSNCESLCEVVVALEAHQSKCYHLGMGRNSIAKTTFATSNQNRDYRIFEDFAFYMMEQARQKWTTDIFKLNGNVYAFDPTTIPLCLAIIAYCLVAIVQHDMQLKRSTYEVLQIMSISLMDKTPLRNVFEKTNFNNVKELDCPLLPGLFDKI